MQHCFSSTQKTKQPQRNGVAKSHFNIIEGKISVLYGFGIFGFAEIFGWNVKILYNFSNYLGGIIEFQIIMIPSPALPLKGKGDQPH